MKIFLLFATFAALLLCSPNVLAQEPNKDYEAVPLEGKAVLVRPKMVRAPVVTDPVTALKAAKSIYVTSSSLLVGSSVVEDKLQKRPEFSQLGLVITRDLDSADLILQLDHDLFTKYVYTVTDRRTAILVAAGKLSSLGGTVAGKVAKRFLEQVQEARQK